MFHYYVIDVYNHGEAKIFSKHIFVIVTILYLKLEKLIEQFDIRMTSIS